MRVSKLVTSWPGFIKISCEFEMLELRAQGSCPSLDPVN